MLIVSKFHDYYDSALGASGVDKSIVYNRIYWENGGQPKSEKTDPKDFPLYKGDWGSYLPRHNIHRVEIYQGVVIFCGKAYPVLMVPNVEHREFGMASPPKYRYIYNDFGQDEQLREQISQKDYATLVKKFEGEHVASLQNVDFSHLNKRYDAPIVMAFEWRYGQFTISANPTLQNIEFYRAVSAYDAFQEIYRFIDTVLVKREDPFPAPLNEKTKLASKGMDSTSFKRTQHPRKSRRAEMKKTSS